MQVGGGGWQYDEPLRNVWSGGTRELGSNRFLVAAERPAKETLRGYNSYTAQTIGRKTVPTSSSINLPERGLAPKPGMLGVPGWRSRGNRRSSLDSMLPTRQPGRLLGEHGGVKYLKATSPSGGYFDDKSPVWMYSYDKTSLNRRLIKTPTRKREVLFGTTGGNLGAPRTVSSSKVSSAVGTKLGKAGGSLARGTSALRGSRFSRGAMGMVSTIGSAYSRVARSGAFAAGMGFLSILG